MDPDLPEVGAPIRDAARDIAALVEDADRALAEAKARHREAIANARRCAARLESKVATLWTPAEVDAAKRGFMLADGREIPLNVNP